MYDHAARGAELIAAMEQVTKEFENDPLNADYQYDLERERHANG